jgi:putative sugar O-methyltransferase
MSASSFDPRTLGKQLVHDSLSRLGYRLHRIKPTGYGDPSHDGQSPLPAGAEQALRSDHPRLLELRQRYATLDLPMRAPGLWGKEYLGRELDLRYFRGDNAYVWQLRNVRAQARLKYYLYCRYIRDLDHHDLLQTLQEDGAFGCWSFEFEHQPRVSRDLLDSINEIYFLDRQLKLFERQKLNVLDIGAGYGRLAHRMLAALPQIEHYYCVDAIPESTFLCEYYLGHRGCLDKAVVCALDEIDSKLSGVRYDFAVNIHSFPEMGCAAISGWLALLARLQVPYLLVVPNDQQHLLSNEGNDVRLDFAHLFPQHGYEQIACEKVIADDDVRELFGVDDYYYLFRRKD